MFHYYRVTEQKEFSTFRFIVEGWYSISGQMNYYHVVDEFESQAAADKCCAALQKKANALRQNEASIA